MRRVVSLGAGVQSSTMALMAVQIAVILASGVTLAAIVVGGWR